jgi:hypothetical protein
MSLTVKLLKFDGEGAQIVAQVSSPQTELKHFRNVTSSVMQDALNVWADIWGEFQDNVPCGLAVPPEAEKEFKPSCGWPDFFERMWLLRHHLEFMARFSRQG